MAIQPEPLGRRDGSPGTDTAELPVIRAGRRRHPLLAACCALIGVCGLAAAGFGLYRQVTPRVFTPAQRQRIEAWEVASRWRTTQKAAIFPPVVRYRLPGQSIGSPGGLTLTARRLYIGAQSSCAAAGGSAAIASALAAGGCQALLRATYSDETGSIVLTVGIAVMRDRTGATKAEGALSGGPSAVRTSLARRPLLAPLRVPGTTAAAFGARQRQLSWVAAAGPYLVLMTAGYADGRPRVAVASDPYTFLEMGSMAHGVLAAITAPLTAPAPAPRCPGNPAC